MSSQLHTHKVCWKCGRRFESSKELFKHIDKEHNKPIVEDLDIFDCDCESCVRAQRVHIKRMAESVE